MIDQVVLYLFQTGKDLIDSMVPMLKAQMWWIAFANAGVFLIVYLAKKFIGNTPRRKPQLWQALTLTVAILWMLIANWMNPATSDTLQRGLVRSVGMGILLGALNVFTYDFIKEKKWRKVQKWFQKKNPS